LQKKIGARRAAAFDIEAACSGFIFGLEIGQQFIMSRTYDTVLVVGAEKLSSIIDWRDRNTCVLFGDGAGAAVLQNRPKAHGLLTACMGADGEKAELLSMPGGGSRCPATLESVSSGLHFLRMDGRETFKSASTPCIPRRKKRCVVVRSKFRNQMRHTAPGQSSHHRCRDRTPGVQPEQVFVNLEKYGNTSAASVAIALDEAVQSGRIQSGDLVLLIVFGAGLTWGAAVIEW